MPPTRIPQYESVLNEKASTGVGTAFQVSDFKNIQLELFTSGNANLTVKIQGSLRGPNNQPDFSIAASSTNRWDYLAVWDLNPSTLIPGSTGIAVTGTDIVKNLLVNVDGIVWLNCVVTAHAAGTVSANAVVYNNW